MKAKAVPLSEKTAVQTTRQPNVLGKDGSLKEGTSLFQEDVPSPNTPNSFRNALIVGAGTLASRLLGFVRDASIAWLLGGSGTADALTAALRIPYMARRLFGEGTLSLSLTAACTRERLRGGSGCRLALAATRKLALWAALPAALFLIGAEPIMRLTAPGLAGRPEVLAEAATLFRICAPYVWSIMLAAGCMAALHSRQRFLLPSLTPALFNLSVIGFALVAACRPDLRPGVLVACGVLCGGLLQWFVQIPAVRRLQREESHAKRELTQTARDVLRRVPAGILGAAMPQLAFLGASALASLLPEGRMASLFYAERLLEFPLGVLGAAVGMAAAPRLAELASSEGLSRSSQTARNAAPHDDAAPPPAFPAHRDKTTLPTPSFPSTLPDTVSPSGEKTSSSPAVRRDARATPDARPQTSCEDKGRVFGEEDREALLQKGSLPPSPTASVPSAFAAEVRRALLLSLGLNLPAAAGLAAVSAPLVAVVLGHGAFDGDAVCATALALCAYAPGLPAYALSRPLLAASHALENGAPIRAAAVALAVSLAAGYALTVRLGAWGPPLGVSIGLWCNAALLWLGVRRSVPLRLPIRSLLTQLAGTALTFGVASGIVRWVADAAPLTRLALAVPAGAAAYALALLLGDRHILRLLQKRR